MTVETTRANGIEFAYLAEGPADGPLALCLHGFPDSAATWRHLLPRLAEAGFRAVAPWMRGYHPTGPAPDGRYQRGALAADALALHEALGGDERAVIVGHDWGAIATYGGVAAAPERWHRAVTIAVPPLAAAGAALTSYEQLRRSFYIFVFQTPLAEGVVAADDFSFIDKLWRDWSPGYDAAEDLTAVKDALRPPDCLAAAIGYYRAMLQPDVLDPTLADLEAAAFQPMPVPTLYLHGDQDGAFRTDLSMVEQHLPEGSEVEEVPNTGHFLHLEDPGWVGKRVVEFLGRE